jgi:pimeloyl-ACP methyl ester carboxylesterase
MNDVNSSGRLVDVGTHRLYLVQVGQGTPAVIIEPGRGQTHEQWLDVQREVAKHTAVFAYDRAGVGRSDPGPMPRHSQRMVAELRMLLEVTHVSPPYILVGHSFGGLNCQLFAKLYPQEIAAMVLVDSSYPEIGDLMTRRLTEAQWEELREILDVQNFSETRVEDGEESGRQVRSAGDLPDVPVTILAGMAGAAAPQGWPDLDPEVHEIERQIATALPQGQFIAVEDAGHYIHRDRPDAVVEAILAVLDRTRAATPRNV